MQYIRVHFNESLNSYKQLRSFISKIVRRVSTYIIFTSYVQNVFLQHKHKHIDAGGATSPTTCSMNSVIQAVHSFLMCRFSSSTSENIICTAAPLPFDRQHPSCDDCLEVKTEYYQNCSVLDCVTQCSQSAAHLCEQFLRVLQIGLVTLVPL